MWSGTPAKPVKRRAAQLWRKVVRALYISRSQERQVIAGFEKAYAAAEPHASWMGAPVTASPLDLWIYQEIVHETHPDLIVAVHTSSAGYLADLCAMEGRGIVLSIELAHAASPTSVGRSRIRSLHGSGVATDALGEAAALARGAEVVMVVLGSGPSSGTLARWLHLYGPLVSVGSYLLVEGTTADRERWEDVLRFVQGNPSFVPDRVREKLLQTGNAGGYLKRLP